MATKGHKAMCRLPVLQVCLSFNPEQEKENINTIVCCYVILLVASKQLYVDVYIYHILFL